MLSLTAHLVINSDGLMQTGYQGTVFSVTLRVKMVLYVYAVTSFGLTTLGL